MNVMLPSSKKALWPLVAAGALALLVLILWATRQETPRSAGQADGAPPPVEIPEAVIEQVAWKVTAFPAGVTGKLTKEQKEAVKRNEVRAGGPVMETVDALVFEPDALGALAGRSATTGAARALARSKLVPSGVKDVKVIRRVARIGIDVAGAKRAAARFAVGYKASLKGEKVRLSLTGAFWLERYPDGWKIVAFEGESKPYRAPEKNNKGKKPNDKQKSKGENS